jgi:hypothetical protein
MKKIVLAMITFCIFSTAVFGREIVIRNLTNDVGVSEPARPTTIMFSFVNSQDHKIIPSVSGKILNNLLLKPGGEIKINSKNFPYIGNDDDLFVNYQNTCGNILLGVEKLYNGNIDLHDYGITDLTSMYGPYYSTKCGTEGNINEIDFYYANNFFTV